MRVGILNAPTQQWCHLLDTNRGAEESTNRVIRKNVKSPEDHSKFQKKRLRRGPSLTTQKNACSGAGDMCFAENGPILVRASDPVNREPKRQLGSDNSDVGLVASVPREVVRSLVVLRKHMRRLRSPLHTGSSGRFVCPHMWRLVKEIVILGVVVITGNVSAGVVL